MAIDVEAVRSSFETAKPIAMEVVSHMYGLLFERYPQTKALFVKVDMEKQKQALIAALVFAVDHLDQPEKLVPVLKKLGAGHVKYGVTEQHYQMVGECVLDTFAHFLGSNWTAHLRDNWAQVYGAVTGLMLEGAAEAQDILTTARTMSRKLLLRVFEELTHEPEFRSFLKARASELLQEALKNEVEDALGKASRRVA